MNLYDALQDAKRRGDPTLIDRLVPYCGFLGLESLSVEGRFATVLRYRPSNIGNTAIPAIHGGVVGALMEHAAAMQLLWETELRTIPKIVNISIDYLRPCLAQDCFAQGVLVKQGKKVANVRVEAWQADRAKPVAAAHAHFLLG